MLDVHNFERHVSSLGAAHPHLDSESQVYNGSWYMSIAGFDMNWYPSRTIRDCELFTQSPLLDSPVLMIQRS